MTSLMLATPDWWIHSCCFPEVSRTLLLPASLLLTSKVRSCPFSLKMEAIWSKNSKKHPKKRIFLINTPEIPVPFSCESQAVSSCDREISKSPVDYTSPPVEPFLPPGLPGSSSNLFTFLQPSFLANLPIQLPPPLPLLPSTPSPPLPPTGRKVPLVSQPLGAPFPESLLPLKDCPNPHFCVGGRNHVDFLRPGVGRDLPYREEVEWFTLR